MKAFVEKKAQYVLSKGFCQKVHVLIKNECMNKIGSEVEKIVAVHF